MRSVSISIAAYWVPRCCVSADPEFESPLGRMWATWSTAMRSLSIESILYATFAKVIVGASWTTCTSDSKIVMGSSFDAPPLAVAAAASRIR